MSMGYKREQGKRKKTIKSLGQLRVPLHSHTAHAREKMIDIDDELIVIATRTKPKRERGKRQGREDSGEEQSVGSLPTTQTENTGGSFVLP
jgi:hypothetical protein